MGKNRFFTAGICLSLFCICQTVAKAQQTRQLNDFHEGRYFSVDIGIGGLGQLNNVKEYFYLHNSRAQFSAQLFARGGYFFSDHFGGYLEVSANDYPNKQNVKPMTRPVFYAGGQTGGSPEDLLEGFDKFGVIRPGFEAGLLYRFNLSRFELLPRLGVGYNLGNFEHEQTIIKDHYFRVLGYQYKGAGLHATAGVNLQYWVAPKGYLSFGATAVRSFYKVREGLQYFEGDFDGDLMDLHDPYNERYVAQSWDASCRVYLKVQLSYGIVF